MKKNELGRMVVKKSIGLRPKMYSYLTNNKKFEKTLKKLKAARSNEK